MVIRIEVVKVRRNCPAFDEGNIMLFDNSEIIHLTDQKGCMSVYATITTNVGRLNFQNPLFISCLDGGITIEGCGNIILKLTREKDD